MQNPAYFLEGSAAFTFVIAHRGFHSAPGCAENSACAIAAAYAAGADGIELDIKTTFDKAPVLGHDYTTARELNNWLDDNNNPVVRSPTESFASFPLVDSAYQNNSMYPFLLDYSLPSDPNNPERSSMYLGQIQNGTLVDTFNVATSQYTANSVMLNHQLTLFEALYLIQKYYPMQVWLDIKSAGDLALVGPVIAAARNDEVMIGGPQGSQSPLYNICLKLD